MNNKLLVIIGVVFISLAVSFCRSNDNQAKSPEIHSLDNVEIIVDVQKKDSINLSSIVSDVSFLRLDSANETAFEKIDQLDYDDSHYFVLDKDYAKKVLVFDSKGKLIAESKAGREQTPIAFSLDKINKQIVIAYKNQRVCKYDYHLNLLKQDSLYLFFNSFAYSPADSTILFNLSKMINFNSDDLKFGNKNEITFELLAYNKNKNVRNLYLPFDLDRFPQGQFM
ncbi:6-bladed beta-propeller [Sphingobacterium sp. E70]|uniref:6-bladed beta-propeller n=1 Tax=Sphingobacterium sp. E70 TaxID=2853439 RepID=UPI00211BAE83|nr:6-bladed beta-propeller [Sphingobacterium sp. E70]ULT27237.1 6-bladed beta-propeller [Sphingobacterium sp. E70]